MRAAVVLALPVLLLAAPAGAGCAHVVTDARGDSFRGAVADPSVDLLHVDLATTATSPARLLVVTELDDVDAKPATTSSRTAWVAFDLGAQRFVVEHVSAGGSASARLLRVAREWPATPAGDDSGPLELETIGPLDSSVDSARDRIAVEVPLDVLDANGATTTRGTTVTRISAVTFAGVETPVAPAIVRADGAERPSSEPYRLGDPSCA